MFLADGNRKRCCILKLFVQSKFSCETRVYIFYIALCYGIVQSSESFKWITYYVGQQLCWHTKEGIPHNWKYIIVFVFWKHLVMFFVMGDSLFLSICKSRQGFALSGIVKYTEGSVLLYLSKKRPFFVQSFELSS